MTSITTSVVVVVASLAAVFVVFLAVARGVREDEDYEVEVRLFPPTIRRRITRADGRPQAANIAEIENASTNKGNNGPNGEIT